MSKVKPRKESSSQSELDELLTSLLVMSLAKANRIPSPDAPPCEDWERQADEYCFRLAQSMRLQEPTPDVACALIPRLTAARVLGSPVQHSLEQQAALGDASANASALLESLLVTTWHQSMKSRWLSDALDKNPTVS